MPRVPRAGRSAGSAFTLLEVLAAVAILGGVVVGVLLACQRARGVGVSANTTMTCARLCASLAARARRPGADLDEARFETPAGYTWFVTPESLPEGAPKGLEALRVSVVPVQGEGRGASVVVWRQGRLDEKGAAP